MPSEREYKIIVALADLHIGRKSVSAETMKKQLKKNFFKIVEKMEPIDLITVCGDASHIILSLNSDYAELYNWFFSKLYRIAKKKNATICR